MNFVCIWSPGWASKPLDGIATAMLRVLPRVALDPGKGQIWADATSLNLQEIGQQIRTVLGQQSAIIACIGVACVPIGAEVAARFKGDQGGETPHMTVVPAGGDREFLASQPIMALGPSAPLQNLFDGVGIEKCGDLARLQHESVEVRFGAEGVYLWRLSRADDKRLVFAAMPRTLPQSSMDWVDYTLSDPERLVFVINALVDNVCVALAAGGSCAREMALVFSLANRTSYEHMVRPSRSTASRKAWMRLIRTHLDRIELPDSVT